MVRRGRLIAATKLTGKGRGTPGPFLLLARGNDRKDPPMRAEDMIATHPDVRGNTATLLVAAVDEVAACALTCTSCADACLAEAMVDRLRQCIRACLDCADVCAATARLATRRTGSNEALLAEMLAVCATACRLCGEECTRHAEMHDHCRLCAEACLASAEACQRALGDVT